MGELRESETKDSNGILVKEDDKISFIYKSVEIEAKVRFNNGFFIVETPGNKPISCMLSDILKHTDVFSIIN